MSGNEHGGFSFYDWHDGIEGFRVPHAPILQCAPSLSPPACPLLFDCPSLSRPFAPSHLACLRLSFPLSSPATSVPFLPSWCPSLPLTSQPGGVLSIGRQIDG